MKHAEKTVNGVSYNRQAGVLMPLFSLPSPCGIGDMGKTAYQFVDMLKESGQTLWALLPMGPTGYCNSPYKSLSAFAGNPYFISPKILVKKGLLDAGDLAQYDFGSDKTNIDYSLLFENRYKLLHKAFVSWLNKSKNKESCFQEFKKKSNYWLDDYCLYMSLKKHFSFGPWNLWPEDIRSYALDARKKYKRILRQDIQFWQFVQYEYYEQWKALKLYANQNNVKIIGDMPFYIEYDSADVWSHREQFAIDTATNDIIWSAGVPGDMFSKLSRNWGMPCYCWQALAASKYKWHLKRFEHAGSLYDIVRVDHAIGFVRYYGMNDAEEKWFEGPDYQKDTLIPKITALMKKTGTELIAEDLGTVPERAYLLFNKYGWLCTRVLQFGFGSKYGTETIHLPFYYPHKSAAYTSTHDNQTLSNYIKDLPSEDISYMAYYLKTKNTSPHQLHQKLIEEAYRSSSEKVIIPMPDILELDNQARICYGREYEKSWRWRLSSLNEVTKGKRNWLRKLTFAYARMPFSKEQGEKYGWYWL